MQPSEASNKILQRLLERLHASLASGPLLQCRPHSSRQRIDLTQFAALPEGSPEQILSALLGDERSVRLRVPAALEDAQEALLGRLRTIAEDARTYEQDTGVHALFLGYPVLHLPPESRGKGTKRVLAPIAFVPVQLGVKLGRAPSVTIEGVTDGAERVVPNAALLAWLSQVTGASFSDVFSDEQGGDSWRELNELTRAVCRALEFAEPEVLEPQSLVEATPRADVAERGVVRSAVLGLFPVSKQGLLSDLQALAAGEQCEGPIGSFLNSGSELGLADAGDEAAQRIASERCVGAADPCQLRAVRLARQASGLVIHGPPGTGKSQTITNVIADHLAAGQRVLFVCDKRTALDVVHYRMQHLGLGQLCAVVHDARRDPRELYRAIREQLDALPDAARDPSCAAALDAADRELRGLHDELAAYTGAIMDGGEDSLHELMGRWFGTEVPEALQCELSDLGRADLRELERDTREMLERGRKESFAANPWTNALGIGLREYLEHGNAHWQASLRALDAAGQAVDAARGSELLPFDAALDLPSQAASRRALAQLLAAVAERQCGGVLATFAAASREERASAARDHEAVGPHAVAITAEPLDRELLGAADGGKLAIPELSHALGRLASYLEIARRWYRFFYFGRRREALAVVQRFGFTLGYDVAVRLQKFLNGLRARKLVQDWLDQRSGSAAERLSNDAVLTKAVEDHALIFRILNLVEDDPARLVLTAALRDPARHAVLVAALRASDLRAEVLAEYRVALESTALLSAEFRAQAYRDACAHELVHPECAALLAREASIEGILRVRERLSRLPDDSRAFHLRLLEQSTDADSGWAAVQKAVLSSEIARRLREAPVLQELDADRIRATYARYRAVEVQRRSLVQRTIVGRWAEQQRTRLLPASGTRLNAAGAEVRRRLVSRGERAMRLRQVIAAGASIEGGDPLFDLRPVWMTSPEVVAQAFPRAPLFDLVVFDEASQCRLEEALPVLARAKRVVIAGDPKQLPPTRFFELATAQSSTEVEAETEQELFEEQQGEVEDLLGASLNLPIEQAYLDVHYRSQNADLIEFSNQHFYESRLQPIPAPPANRSALPPLRLVEAFGTYDKRANLREAEEVVRIVRELLACAKPPSIGIACFNLTQRDVIALALDRAAAEAPQFGVQLAAARTRRGEASFEGLFVKNLENVQGDERDQIIISTTYGPDPSGRFYKRFGPLGMPGGGRRLNVLVTRAREAVHIVTSIPRETYRALPAIEAGRQPNGAWLLFAYLSYAVRLAANYATDRERTHEADGCRVLESTSPSALAEAVGKKLAEEHGLANEVHWGNSGFGVDVAVNDATLGVLCDATRYDKAPDRVQWDIFRTEILEAQGWKLQRLWTPHLFRNAARAVEAVAATAEGQRVAEPEPREAAEDLRPHEPVVH